MHFVDEYRNRVPQGLLKKNDDFSAILENIVDLESGKSVNSSETLLQSSSQALLMNDCSCNNDDNNDDDKIDIKMKLFK